MFDAPINTNDQNLAKVLAQKLPVALYLYNRADRALDEALTRAAREHKGRLLVARVQAVENPQTYAQYGRPALPALVTLKDGQAQSSAAGVVPAEVGAHIHFLLGLGPKPSAAGSAQTASAKPITISDANFASEVLRSPLPVLVDFWAPWCGPCHMVAPAVEKIAQKYAGRLKVAKLNVDENPRMAAQYQAMSIPLLLVFKGGQPVSRLVGAQPQSQIEQAVEKALRG